MASTCSFIEARLKLRLNRDKSAVDHATRRTLLGFAFFKRGGEIKVRIDPKARKRAKDRLRELTSRSWGVSMERRIRESQPLHGGWTAYFALADTPRPLSEVSMSGCAAGCGRSAGRNGSVRDQTAQPASAGSPAATGP